MKTGSLPLTGQDTIKNWMTKGLTKEQSIKKWELLFKCTLPDSVKETIK